jgi:hypothetical protein
MDQGHGQPMDKIVCEDQRTEKRIDFAKLYVDKLINSTTHKQKEPDPFRLSQWKLIVYCLM